MAEPIKSLGDYLRAKFGAAVTYSVNPVVSSVGTTATEIARHNPRRLGLTLINLSSNTLYVAPDNNVSATRSILLPSNGGGLSLSADDDFVLPMVNWFAVASGASSAIYVIEVVLI
jgi:hypothetical protein